MCVTTDWLTENTKRVQRAVTKVHAIPLKFRWSLNQRLFLLLLLLASSNVPTNNKQLNTARTQCCFWYQRTAVSTILYDVTHSHSLSCLHVRATTAIHTVRRRLSERMCEKKRESRKAKPPMKRITVSLDTLGSNASEKPLEQYHSKPTTKCLRYWVHFWSICFCFAFIFCCCCFVFGAAIAVDGYGSKRWSACRTPNMCFMQEANICGYPCESFACRCVWCLLYTAYNTQDWKMRIQLIKTEDATIIYFFGFISVESLNRSPRFAYERIFVFCDKPQKSSLKPNKNIHLKYFLFDSLSFVPTHLSIVLNFTGLVV